MLLSVQTAAAFGGYEPATAPFSALKSTDFQPRPVRSGLGRAPNSPR